MVVNKAYLKLMLEQAKQDYDNRLLSVAKLAYNNILKPWFEKYHLEFKSGMGSYYLGATEKTPKWFKNKYMLKGNTYNGKPSYLLDYDLLPKNILDVLEMELDFYSNNAMYDMLPDYSPE